MRHRMLLLLADVTPEVAIVCCNPDVDRNCFNGYFTGHPTILCLLVSAAVAFMQTTWGDAVAAPPCTCVVSECVTSDLTVEDLALWTQSTTSTEFKYYDLSCSAIESPPVRAACCGRTWGTSNIPHNCMMLPDFVDSPAAKIASLNYIACIWWN